MQGESASEKKNYNQRILLHGTASLKAVHAMHSQGDLPTPCPVSEPFHASFFSLRSLFSPTLGLVV